MSSGNSPNPGQFTPDTGSKGGSSASPSLRAALDPRPTQITQPSPISDDDKVIVESSAAAASRGRVGEGGQTSTMSLEQNASFSEPTPNQQPQQLAGIHACKSSCSPISSSKAKDAEGQSSASSSARLDSSKVKEFLDKIQADNTTFANAEELSNVFRSFLNPPKPPLSPGQVKAWDTARTTFYDHYSSNRELYEQLTEQVKGRCKDLLKPDSAKSIFHILHQEPTGRAKELKSLHDKLEKEIPGLMRKGDSTEPETQLYHRIVDLAGVRILVYFPEDVGRVVQRLRDSREFDIWDATVSFSRSRTDSRMEDKTNQRKGILINYPEGPWIDKFVSTEHIIRRWKNSGYRAAHLHVTYPARGKEGEDKTLPDTQQGTTTGDAADATLVHTPRVSQASDNVQSALSDGLGIKERPLSELTFPQNKVVEIQITTVVMHAWSQVEHDVIYKNPYHIPVNNTMARMLDAVNGLSINSEIMLEELQRTMDEAKRQKEMTPFTKDWELLPTTLKQDYLEDSGWKADPVSVAILSMIARSLIPFSIPQLDIGTPAKLRVFLERYNIVGMPRAQEEEFDLASVILEVLSHEFRYHPDALHVIKFPTSRASVDQTLHDTLYNWLLSANVFSIMVAIGPEVAVQEFQNQFEDDADSLRIINAMILGIKVPVESDTRQKLDKFAAKVLQLRDDEFRTAAVILATLWVFVDVVEHARSSDSLSYANLQKSCRHSQSVIFQPLRWHLCEPTKMEYVRPPNSQSVNLDRPAVHDFVRIEATKTSYADHTFLGFGEQRLNHNWKEFNAEDPIYMFHTDSRGGVGSEVTLLLRCFHYEELMAVLVWMKQCWERSYGSAPYGYGNVAAVKVLSEYADAKTGQENDWRHSKTRDDEATGFVFKDFYDTKPFTARELAVIYGHREAALAFPKYGAEEIGNSFSCACLMGDMRLVEDLWALAKPSPSKSPYTPNNRNDLLELPLELAVISVKVEIVAFLLKHNMHAYRGALCAVAARQGSVPMLKLPEEHGYSLVRLDDRYRTPLWYAIQYDHLEATKFLLEVPFEKYKAGFVWCSQERLYLGSGHPRNFKPSERIRHACSAKGLKV